jgi:hypothetical protein
VDIGETTEWNFSARPQVHSWRRRVLKWAQWNHSFVMVRHWLSFSITAVRSIRSKMGPYLPELLLYVDVISDPSKVRGTGRVLRRQYELIIFLSLSKTLRALSWSSSSTLMYQHNPFLA